jgi:hypothetical protein
MPETEPVVEFYIIKSKGEGKALFYRRGVLPETKIEFINGTNAEDLVIDGQIEHDGQFGTRPLPEKTTITAQNQMRDYHFKVRNKKNTADSRQYRFAVQPKNGDKDLCFVVHPGWGMHSYMVSVAKRVNASQNPIEVRFHNKTDKPVTIIHDIGETTIQPKIPGDVPLKRPIDIKFRIKDAPGDPDTIRTLQSGGTEQAEIVIIGP